MSLKKLDVRGTLDALSPLIARAWGGSYIEEFRKQKAPRPNPNWLLNMCLRGNRPDLARPLLEAGTDPLAADPYDEFSWEHALEPQSTELLLEYGVPPNGGGEPGTANWLHTVAFHKRPSTIRLLLERGANPEARDRTNRTALMISAHYGDAESVKALLDAGADPNACIEHNWCDETALTIAAYEGQVSGPDAGVREDGWNPGWIPFTTNGGGDHLCVDLAPANGGVDGQIISMYHAEEKREWLAASFREWLANLAEELENGEWAVDDEGGLCAAE